MEVSVASITDTIRKFAEIVVRKHGLRVRNTDYVIEVRSEMLSDWMVSAGNPVRIIISLEVFADAWKRNDFYDFNRVLEDALRKVPKMLRTLAVVPLADVLRWNAEIKRWKKLHGFPEDYMPPIKYQIPRCQLNFTRIIAVNVRDIESGKKASVWDFAHRTSYEELEVRAAEKLAKVINGEIDGDES